MWILLGIRGKSFGKIRTCGDTVPDAVPTFCKPFVPERRRYNLLELFCEKTNLADGAHCCKSGEASGDKKVTTNVKTEMTKWLPNVTEREKRDLSLTQAEVIYSQGHPRMLTIRGPGP